MFIVKYYDNSQHKTQTYPVQFSTIGQARELRSNLQKRYDLVWIFRVFEVLVQVKEEETE